MPNTRRATTSTFRRGRLSGEIREFGFVKMRPCNSCTKSDVSCKISLTADRCMRCSSKNLECNLVPFSPVKWRRLQVQRRQKDQEIKEALARLNRLQNEREELEKKSLNMVDNEVANIEDQEQDEAIANIFPIDVVSETVDSPQLDWSPFAAGPAETAVEASGSSQDS